MNIKPLNFKKLVRHLRGIYYLTIGISAACSFSSCSNGVAQMTDLEEKEPEATSEVVVATPTIQPVAKVVTHPPVFPLGSNPRISSASAVVMDVTSGEVLYGKNENQKRAVASTQKIMTALIAQEVMPGAMVTVPKEATTIEPSKLYVGAGTRYPMDHLVKALMVKSANDIAYVIAHNVAGSEPAFEEMMNERALRIGMVNSHFMNPHGLTETGQYSTAYDIALLAKTAYQNPYIRECIGTKSMTFNYSNGRTKALNNTNRLLKRVSYCTGMKTGTTRASKYCLVSTGELNGRIVAVVVLGAPSRVALYNESEGLLRWALER